MFRSENIKESIKDDGSTAGVTGEPLGWTYCIDRRCLKVIHITELIFVVYGLWMIFMV